MTDPSRAGNEAAPVAVEWRILSEDLPDKDENSQVDEAVSGDGLARARLFSLVSILLLAVLLVHYATWDGLDRWLGKPQPWHIGPALMSADQLAASARVSFSSEYLRFLTTGTDASVVALHGAEMDALYAERMALVGLRPHHGQAAPDGRLVLVLVAGSRIEWDDGNGRVLLPSPRDQPLFFSRSQADMLHQSWLAALADRAALDVAKEYAVPYGWFPLLSGLRLWLLWDGDGPLSVGKRRIVGWLGDPVGKGLSLDEVADICRVFAAWRLSPLAFEIPVGCDQSGYFLPSAVPFPITLEEIAPIFPPKDSLDDQYTPSIPMAGKAVAVSVALLYDYTTERYGRDSLARLLGALSSYDNWGTLIPAVYGVSAEVFEAGWRAWLAEEYGL